MTRKILTAAIAVTALLVSVLALNATNADAVPTCPYDAAVAGVCGPILTYPGPFTNHPPCDSYPYFANVRCGGPYGFGTPPTPTYTPPTAVPAGGTGGGSPGLAVTGSESTVLGYVGTGLIAFGAVALGSRRKFFQGALD